MWMSGYGGSRSSGRGEAARSARQGARRSKRPTASAFVLITLDLVGIDRDTSMQNVCRRLEEKHGLKREQIAINCSHTHCGPVAGTTLLTMYFFGDEDRKLVATTRSSCKNKIVECVDRGDGTIASGPRYRGEAASATFAVNRRENKAEDVPQLQAVGHAERPDRSRRAGAGRAWRRRQAEEPSSSATPAMRRRSASINGAAIIRASPIANWRSGIPARSRCSGPAAGPIRIRCRDEPSSWPNNTASNLADSVDAVLAGGAMKPLAGTIDSEVRRNAARSSARSDEGGTGNDGGEGEQIRSRPARRCCSANWRKTASSRRDYPYYPVQVWKLGDDGPRWVLLGGEVVVDYALRLKHELGAERTWVAGYSNDVMAYIPSRRVLTEGGYEGATSMIYYGLPSPWAPMLEEAIVGAVRKQAER